MNPSRAFIAFSCWLGLVCQVFAATAGVTSAGTTSYPNNGMRRIGACELSDNLFRSLYNAVYDPTTGYAYFSTAGGTNVNPGRIIKVDCNGPLPVEVGSCQCAAGEFNLNSGVLDTANGYGYFGVLSTTPGRIAKIALGSGSAAPAYLGSTALNSGENPVMGAVADVANGYAYFACATNPGKVVKVSMPATSALPVRIGAATLNSGEGALRRGVIDPAGGCAYFASLGSTPTIVAKIALGAGGAAPSRAGVVTIDSVQHNIGSAVIDTAGGHAWFGSYDTSSVPAKIYKVSLGAGAAAPSLVATTPLNGVERELCSAVIDPVAGYAFFGTDHTYPGKIYKFSLGAGDGAPVELGTLALNSGASSNPADGQNVSNVVTVPPVAPLPWGEVFLQSAVYDTARGYAYFGTDSSPGQVVKASFSQKSQIKGTRIVLAGSAVVNDMRFYSHSASGNVRLAIYDNAATKNRLWQAEIANTAAGAWLTAPVSGVTLAPGTYWLAWQVDSSADVPGYTAGASGDGFSFEQTYGAFPSALGGTTSTAEKWGVYLDYDAVSPLAITTGAQIAPGTTGDAVSVTLATSGGASPCTWSITGGALPAGLTLSSAGVLSGTPTAAGSYAFTVQVVDALGTTATQQFAITIAPRVPSQWVSHGMGGGGGMYAPSFSPFDPNELYLSCDMSELFHTTTLGTSWETVDFRQVQGFRESEVQFTSDPLIRYVLDFKFNAATGVALQRPLKSTDGGATWNTLPGWAGRACSVWADPSGTTRLVVATANDIFVSADGGATFSASLFNLANNRVAGVFFDGQDIYIGCNAGLLVSHDGGGSFASAGIGGIPAGEAMFSFAGAKQGGTVRFYCVTLASFVVFPGAILNPFVSRGVYTMDVGQANWTAMMNGFTSGTDFPSHVAMARNNISTVYVAAARGSTGTFYPDRSTVFKANAPGATWQRVFIIYPNNQNISTGWAGYPNSSSLNFANPIGFTVHPGDPNRLCITDSATAHITTNGGTTWTQIYVNPGDQNAANHALPGGRAYHGIGLEPTACFWLHWLDASNLLAGYSDMRLIRSHDGGASWAYDYSGLSDGECYQIVQHANGTLYALSSTIVSPYGVLGSDNTSIDASTGTVRLSTNGGANWSTLHNFGAAPMWLALDPANADTMYVAVAHSSLGGIYLTQNLSAGINSTWTKLPAPARATGGHPYDIRLLDDGSLVCSYSLNYDGSSFALTSGVFITANPTAGAGATWLDRSATGMKYWTQDVVIDPHDATQNTWYAAVWNAWGAGNPNPAQQGGLYKTANRGQSWTRVFSADSVNSCTINPVNADEMYVTTRFSGLWYGSNLSAASPNFTQLAEYPFREPTRVFYNPANLGEIWVTSNGNGLRTGSVPFGGVVQFSASSYSVNENGGSIVITVKRTAGKDGVVSVNYATGNGSATAGINYAATSGTLTWGDGDVTDKTFSVPVTDDLLYQPDKTVNLTLSNPTNLAVLGTPGTAVLTIVNTDAPMDEWRAGRFTAAERADSSISGAGADPDHDGIPNLLEYAFNRDPKHPDTAGMLAPAVSHNPVDGQDYLTITYTRRKPPRDITYHVEVSGDLVTWNEGGAYATETQATDDGNGVTESVTARAVAPVTPGGRLFMRVRVTQP